MPVRTLNFKQDGLSKSGNFPTRQGGMLGYADNRNPDWMRAAVSGGPFTAQQARGRNGAKICISL